MFLDKVEIVCKAGNGGDGAVSFRREKHVPNGGPNGGDGGNGGNIIFRTTNNLTNLIDFRFKKVFRAENGENGKGTNRYGKNGQDLTILVPRGTVIRNADNGKVVADLTEENEEILLLKGGKGGWGNARFVTSTRQAPRFSELGVKTKEFKLLLELKTIADVGLVGFPNVGKSTLLSCISNAKPKIANYHFTTLSPNIGVVKAYDKSFVMADIPGLISGASEGVGLGLDFLRHIERTKLLVHVVDISSSEGRNPIDDYNAINYELENYSEKVANIPQIIALNKIDLLEDQSMIEKFKKAVGNVKIVAISAAGYMGLDELLKEIVSSLPKENKIEKVEIEDKEIDKRDLKEYFIDKLNDKEYYVHGELIDDILRRVALDDYRSNAYFQKRIKDEGIIDALKDKGVKNGDIVYIGDIELEFEE